MTNAKINYILVGIVALVVGLMIGLHFAGTKTITVGSTPAGGTTTTAHFYSVAVAMSGTATSSSILNTSTNDFLITSIEAGCEGLGTAKSYVTGSGIANLTLSVATSSTASPITTNANVNLAGNLNISTSTPNFVLASTTSANQSLVNNIWLAGSYLTFYNNATTTGNCTFGVKAFSL